MGAVNVVISWWIFPVVSALMWLSMLFSLFFVWYTNGKQRLPSMDASQHIPYLSDTGAYSLKPLFIAGSVVTVVCLDIGFFAERWLRHTGRLAKNTSWTQKILSICSLIFALAGAAGLILLSIFDTYHHPHLHDVFVGIFIVGYIISAIFLCAEYQRLGIHYRHHRVLAISFWIKLAFIFVEVILAIVFITMSAQKRWNIAAVFEWTISLVFTFYVLSFIVDLLPSVRTKSHLPQGHKDLVMAETGVVGPRFSESSTTYEHNLTHDSAGPNQPGPKFVPEGSVPPRRKGVARLFSNLA